MTGRPVLGCFIALLVELPNWTKIRWDFDDDACGKAWQLTCILILLAGALIYLEGTPYLALPNLLTWLPALLLPMQFVQSFGMKDSLPLNTFSFLAKQRRRRNQRLGLTEFEVQVNFGNIFFVTTLVSATLGSRSNGPALWAYLPGIVVLSGWMLLSASGKNKPWAMLLALSFAAGISVAGQMGLQALEDWYGGSGQRRSYFDPNNTSTMIGRVGPVEQSKEILWRLRPIGNKPPPLLLRTASYNSFASGGWRIDNIQGRKFSDLPSIVHKEIPYTILLPDTYDGSQLVAVREDLPSFSIRGGATSEAPLPLPGDAASVRDFELDGIERNTFGTVRIFPKHSIIEGTILWRGGFSMESPPVVSEDTALTGLDNPALAEKANDKIAAKKVVSDLKLNEQPTLELKLRVLKSWFLANFEYTRNLKITRTREATPLAQFLLTKRAGHCEYFATAATLILREAGIPARYAVGYSVSEWDSKRAEFVIRGTHGHAWCRVWDAAAGKWIDFDTTPPSWTALVNTAAPRSQEFYDTVQRIREDFFIWRNRPTNRLGVTLVMSAIGLAVATFVIRRLWKSKRRLEEIRLANGYEGPVVKTPLNGLEPAARKLLGFRSPGQPFGEWLAGLRSSLPDTGTLDEAIDLHQRLRFDPAPQHESVRSRLAELASRLEAAIGKAR